MKYNQLHINDNPRLAIASMKHRDNMATTRMANTLLTKAGTT
ncbi:hypothetical protein TRICHSKD4_3878 [Roseibium sp. TrichSKD4]|nr:hypothetical protein TRICHSKD4_3878 [Roseibium sp. TrichSKD4]